MNEDQKNNNVKKVTLDTFQEQAIVWIDYEDGTYKAIFVERIGK